MAEEGALTVVERNSEDEAVPLQKVPLVPLKQASRFYGDDRPDGRRGIENREIDAWLLCMMPRSDS